MKGAANLCYTDFTLTLFFWRNEEMDRSARQARLDRRRGAERRGQMKWVFYIGIVAVVIAGMLIYASRVRSAPERTYLQPNGLSLGDPNAPVQMVEYADFQCPHCYNVYLGAEDELIETYIDTGLVHFTYRPVGFLGPESDSSAAAAFCAGEQNLFWPYHDTLFANFSHSNAGGYSESRLVSMADSVGLDVPAFEQCMADGTGLAGMQAAVDEARANGVNGTPAFIINGTLLGGSRTFEQLAEVIDAALAASGN